MRAPVLIALPGSPDKVGTTGLPVHRGSHMNDTEYARRALSTRLAALVREYGGLDQAPPEVLVMTGLFTRAGVTV